ncbi:MAG: DUF1214 domain-containing protein [Alphaproteobacteria bacterium]|nr:DUF1214 domain-containing protein [Alphaproteobacteria bacterium]
MKALLVILAVAASTLPGFARAGDDGCPVAAGRDLRQATRNDDIFAAGPCDPYTLGVQAYVWGFPIVEAAKIRLFFTRPDDPFSQRPPSVAGAALNHFGHGRILADPDNLSGVGPNNDTLYSNAVFDLSQGPFLIEFPDYGDRYYTFSVAHPDSSTTQSLGRRTHGSQLPPLFLHAADYAGPVPADAYEIASADRYLMLFGRVLVKGPEDLDSIRALQDAIRVRKVAGGKPVEVPPPADEDRLPAAAPDDPLAFLGQLRVAIGGMAVVPRDQALVERLRRFAFDAAALDAQGRAELARGLRDGKAVVEGASHRFGRWSGGWSVNTAGARFGSDYLLRAAVAKDQIYVTVPEEAIYPNAREDSSHQPLTGARRYVIRMPPPPVRGFWSITLYDDKGAMVQNPINRYSIGDRTPELKREADGTVAILISHDRPQAADANWLPAPAGPFYLMMRLYIPGAEITAGRWSPPPIQAR